MGSADSAVALLDGDVDGSPPQVVEVTHAGIFQQWVFLGWTAFGGPSAHIGIFRKTFVERLRWLSEDAFMELLALGSCLPGPTSTQVSFALGMMQQGWSGGLLSGALFQYPGAILMTLAGIGAARVLEDPPPALRAAVAGLTAVGVSLVVSAASSLTRGICGGVDQQVITVISAAAAFYYQAAWIYPALILGGGLVTLATRGKSPITAAGPDVTHEGEVPDSAGARTAGACLIALWAAVLVAAEVAVRLVPYHDAPAVHWFEGFYRTGSFIFGGGQVMLPMLLNVVFDPACTEGGNALALPAGYTSTEWLYLGSGGRGGLCGDSWVTKDEFYAGLAAAQAMPGPLFNFAAYLGAVTAKHAGRNPVLGAAVAWLGIFTPGVLMMFALLPWWSVFRKWPLYRRALPGLNAAAIGLLVAASFQLVFQARQTSSMPSASICIGIIGWGLTEVLAVPVPLAILAGGALGVGGWALHLH